MSVTVVIPFRGGCPWRARALSFVVGFYRDCFPGWQLVLADDGGEMFSRGRSVNQAVDACETELVVINDADSLPSIWRVGLAVRSAEAGDGMFQAFGRYRRLTREATERLEHWRDVAGGETDWQQEPSQSHGCVAVRRSVFLDAGGYDDRYQGWGYEDLDLNMRVPLLRHGQDDLMHLWHPGEQPNPENVRLYEATWR